MRAPTHLIISAAAVTCALAACGRTVPTTKGAAPVTSAIATVPVAVTDGNHSEPTTILIGEPPPITGIAAEVGRRAGDAMRSLNPYSDPVEISLRADQRELAQQFVDEFGDKVAVTLGMFRFPNIDAAQSYPVTCPDLPTGNSDGQFEWSLDGGTFSSVSGADLSLSVSIKNVSASPFPWFSGGRDAAYVTERGTRRVVGVGTMGLTDEGHSGTIEAGATLVRSAYGGTTTCDKALGWALAPGNYDVYIVFAVYGDGASKSYLSPPFPLVINDEKPSLPTPGAFPPITPPLVSDVAVTTTTPPPATGA